MTGKTSFEKASSFEGESGNLEYYTGTAFQVLMLATGVKRQTECGVLISSKCLIRRENELLLIADSFS